MYKSDYDNEASNSSNWKQQDAWTENDFVVKRFFQNSLDQDDEDEDYRVEPSDEESFTDIRSCRLLIDTDSESSRSSSPIVFENEQPERIFYPSSSKQNKFKSNDILEKNNTEQMSATSGSLDEILHLIHDDPYKFIFSASSKDKKNYTHCRILRNKYALSETFYLEIESDNHGKKITLLTAKKERKVIGPCQYLISLDSNFGINLCSAELLSSNVIGTKYMLYAVNDDHRQELAMIAYESNFLGFNGPRKLNVRLPTINHQMQALFDENEIEEYSYAEQNDSFIRLYNKPPNWDDETNTYVLQFDGSDRVTTPSVKNFQMIIENKNHVEHVVMQFGRMSDDVFSCDFRYPLSFVQAFSIGLSAFETRLFRE